jgi:hypothetical protein
LGDSIDLFPDLQTEEPTKQAAGRQRDPIFEALAEIEGSDLNHLTKTGRGAINAARRDILAASPDVTAEEIRARARVYRRLMPTAPLTATALAKNWARCGLEPTFHAPAQLRRSEPEEPPRWFPRLQELVEPDAPILKGPREWAKLSHSDKESVILALCQERQPA